MSTTNAVTTPSASSLVTKPTTTAPPTTQSLTSQLGADAFLKLLTTELSNQDPLKPVDQTASIAQLAQFSATQSAQALQASFASFQSNFSVMQTVSLIGKTATVSGTDASGNSSSITGTVGPISVVNGSPEFTLIDNNGHTIASPNGQPQLFAPSQILGIK